MENNKLQNQPFKFLLQPLQWHHPQTPSSQPPKRNFLQKREAKKKRNFSLSLAWRCQAFNNEQTSGKKWFKLHFFDGSRFAPSLSPRRSFLSSLNMKRALSRARLSLVMSLQRRRKKNIELWQQLREEKENAICLRPQPESSSELDLKWKNIHLSDWKKKSVNWFGLWKNIFFFFAFAPAPSGFCTANMYSPYTQHRQIINIKYQIPKPRPILEIYFLDAALRVSNPNHRKSISLTPPRTQPWMGLVRRAKRLAHEPPQPWLCRKKYKIAA